MKISFPPQTLARPLSAVSPLNVIRLNREFYMVTSKKADFDSGDGPEIDCLNLHSGAIENFPPGTLVELMQSTLNIQDALLIPNGPALRPEDVIINGSEEQLIRIGQKIQAIKAVRERTGLGLREAKDVVDAAATRMGC